jgi:hypothetical protein
VHCFRSVIVLLLSTSLIYVLLFRIAREKVVLADQPLTRLAVAFCLSWRDLFEFGKPSTNYSRRFEAFQSI